MVSTNKAWFTTNKAWFTTNKAWFPQTKLGFHKQRFVWRFTPTSFGPLNVWLGYSGFGLAGKSLQENRYIYFAQRKDYSVPSSSSMFLLSKVMVYPPFPPPPYYGVDPNLPFYEERWGWAGSRGSSGSLQAEQIRTLRDLCRESRSGLWNKKAEDR